ncbi:MAG: ABC transporter ATP-binding protein/permease [Proteobacteria bacterium]|nr:ABC transporter ATP-binding protein/permease [Pseudomonadota bacterium]MBU1738656.1 ABC transporter ATP-binding protein/permease [Pseudomonadota bacterium]
MSVGVIPSKEQFRQALNALRLVFPAFIRFRYQLFAGIIALLGVDLFQLLIPRVVKRSIDDMHQAAATPDSLFQQGLLIVFFAVGIALCRFAWRILILGFSRKLERDLRDRILEKVLSLDRPFFNKHPAGEIMALSGNDLSAVQMACGIGLVSFIDAILMTGAALCFMAYIHPTLTLVALAPIPVLAVLTGLLTSLMHNRFNRVQELFSTLTEFARSTLSSVRLIKAYTQESAQTVRFDALGRSYVRNNIRLAMVQGVLFPFSTFIANTSLLLVVFFGGRLTISGTISIGDFVAFMSYLFLMTWPMMAIGWVTNLFQRGITSLNRIRRVLEVESVFQKEGITLPDPEGCEIRVRNLTFTYEGQHSPTLKNIDLDIGPGLTAIVGKTGAGKSTLCQLLARIYPVADGTIFWQDRDVNHLDLAGVRKKISYLPQETILFSDTISANISFGRPDASREEIEQAATLAGIHDEIMTLPNGYQSRVGEKGLLLSGGQRQRIGLARTLLIDRPVIILDDGLSAVDTTTEHTIISHFQHWMAGKTCIMVSHRVAPVEQADTIIVMAGGAVAAIGAHRELYEKNAYYRTICDHQMAKSEEVRMKNEE